MTENNNQNDEPTEEQTPSDETQAEYREISEEELKKILEYHKKWLDSDGKEGERADLKKANLQEAILSETNLQEAQLRGANLQKVRLRGANLQKVRLWGANLQKALFLEANLQEASLDGADLQKAKLRRANLQEASLDGANLQEASLDGANMQKARLDGANLQLAILIKANLQNAVLDEANLQKANLRESNLHNANLTKANMQNTVLDGVKGLNEAKNLQYANFQGATGLLGNEFAKADVTGVKLPDGIKEFKALEIIKETSQNARKIFFAMLLGCVYSWLTIATTTDVRLLTNTASSPLPIIQTEIPIAGFYWAAPLVLICLYFYFHLYLLKLWEALASLPAIFPDGKRLDERAYPWLLNGLVRRHFKRLKAERPFISYIQEWITIFLAWWVVPITMMAFWLRFIPRHDWIGTIFHIGLIVLSVAFSIIFYRLCASTLQGKEKVSISLKKFWRDRRFYYGIGVAVVGVLFLLLSYGAIEGIIPRDRYTLNETKINFYRIKETIPWAFEKIGYHVFADFREKAVSEKTERYWEVPEDDLPKYVKGANLKGRNLNNADMFRAFLVKADLRWASLNGTNLAQANLQQAQLLRANLQGAYLWRANLQQANLELANLQQARLLRANLQQAYLGGANLQQTYLVDSKLQKGYLIRANLQQAQLLRANLQGAYLWRANLQQANLREANLQNANFLSADLTGAKNLTIEQLTKVKTLYKAKLDPDLMEQVKKCCPHLLEEPKEEEDQKDETE